MAGDSSKVDTPSSSRPLLKREFPSPLESANTGNVPRDNTPMMAIPKSVNKIDLPKKNVEQLTSLVERLNYPELELVPSPELPAKEGFNQKMIVGWTSDTIATVLGHFEKKLTASGFTLDTRASVDGNAATVIAQKPDGTGSVEVNVGREEGGKTRVMVQFDAPK
jgi:hypothetical protein